MSEEEKKAIEILKEVASDEFSTIGDDISPKMAQNILNVISRQQKEIDEKSTIIMAGAEKVKQLEKEIEEKNCLIDVLQHRIEELLDNKKEINYIKPIDIPVHNYINEDKIKEKIKKAKEIKWHTPKLVIEYFEELLEENDE